MSAPAAAGMEFAQAIPVDVLGRQALVVPVCGWLLGQAAGAAQAIIEIDGRPAGELRLDEPVPPRLWRRDDLAVAPARGFAGELRLDEREPGFEHVVKITLVNEGNERRQVSVYPVKRIEMARVDASDRRPSPRIAICMAVYNPVAAAFTEQVRSISGQQCDDWICIVSDDGSDLAHEAMIRRTIASDSRFFYFRNERNVGFYRNFERALARVPDGIEFIALADQDDRWYPDKLSSLVDALAGDALLSYSDMRVVSEVGEELAPSYWGYRRNSFDDLRLMLVANTVTGAACMMRRELLEVLLPFPPRVGEAFHDHWIACAALAGGRISYVDRPLYDYIQHGTSVIGHCGFDAPRRRRAPRKAGWLAHLRPANLRSLAARFTGAGQAVYWHECRRIETLCRNLLARGAVRADRRGALKAYGRGLASMGSLMMINLTTRHSARVTDNAERRLAHGYLIHVMLRTLQRLT